MAQWREREVEGKKIHEAEVKGQIQLRVEMIAGDVMLYAWSFVFKGRSYSGRARDYTKACREAEAKALALWLGSGGKR
jgi:hypothetical protein